MKKRGLCRALALLLTLGLLAGLLPAGAAAADSGYRALEQTVGQLDAAAYDGFVFRLRDDLSAAQRNALAKKQGGDSGIQPVEWTRDCYTADSLEQLEAFTASENLASVEPNYLRTLYDAQLTSAVEPNDRFYASYQWNLQSLEVPEIWAYGIEGQDLDDAVDLDGDGVGGNDDIVIAVIDSGLKTGHEDIDWERILPGRSFLGGDESSFDDSLGHGTFVTGQIMAAKDNGLGIAGLLQQVQVLPLKVFEGENTADSVIISAVSYAVEQKQRFAASGGAQGVNVGVINMSLGSPSSSSALEAACRSAIDAGIIVVCAAGNDGDTTASYPAQYAIGVGSTDADGGVSDFSQRLSAANGAGYENKVWVSAPGGDIVSLYCDSTTSYCQASGTSFASPEVAALAAVALSLDNTMNHTAFRQLLKDTAIASTGGSGAVAGQDVEYGWGQVSFARTVQVLLGSLEGESTVRVEVRNEAGSLVEGAQYALYEMARDESGAELPGQQLTPNADGSYTLARGSRYWYSASAKRYDSQTGQFAALSGSRTLTITLKGQTYRTRISAVDTAGRAIADASVTVKKSTGEQVPQELDGTFGTRNGVYSYAVSAPGCFTVRGSFTIDDTQDAALENGRSIQVVLRGAQDVCSVDFTAAAADGTALSARVAVTAAGGRAVEPDADGAYKLEPGQYTYTVSHDSYRAQTGSLTVTEADRNTEKRCAVTLGDRLSRVYLDVMPLTVTAQLTVTDSYGQPVAAYAYGEYRLPDGDYRYEARAAGCNTYTGAFTVSGKKLYVDVQMEPGSAVVDDGSARNTTALVVENHALSRAQLQQLGSEAAASALLAAYVPQGVQLEGAEAVTGDGASLRLTQAELEAARVSWDGDAVTLHSGGQTLALRALRSLRHAHLYTITGLSQPDCTQPGAEQLDCACGDRTEQALPPLGHTYSDGVCTRCGASEAEDGRGLTVDGAFVPLSRLYAYAASGTYRQIGYYGDYTSVYCTGIPLIDLLSNFAPMGEYCVNDVTVRGVDGYAVQLSVTQLASAMIAWEMDGEAPYTQNGLHLVLQDGASANWVEAPCELELSRSRAAHDLRQQTVQPTCTEAGYTRHTCATCGVYYDTDHVNPLGHSYADTVTAPTCLGDGYTTHVCTRCRDTYHDGTVPALGHDYALTRHVPATCSAAGLDVYTCRRDPAHTYSETAAPVDCASAAFTDVARPGSWSHDGIDFAVARGLFQGISASRFAPDQTMTRAMLVTVLYRLAGTPECGAGTAFSDVAAGRWFSRPIAWASETGLVNGVGQGRFAPEEPVSREQLVTILWRYTAAQGGDTTASAELSAFADANTVSSYARSAMAWAVGAGLVNGTSATQLSPRSGASRAQVAAILMRYIQMEEEK